MSTFTDDQLNAIQNVVDRVAANQDGAPATRVAEELRAGLDAAGVPLEPSHVERIAHRIDAVDGNVSAREILQD